MTRAAVGAIAPVIRLGGQELAGATLASLIGVRISSGLRIPSRATIDFLDSGFAISAGATFDLGASIEISTIDKEVLFTGEITGVNLDIERGAPNLTVIADDAAYKMTLGTKVRTFTQDTYSGVVQKIADEYSIKLECTATSGMQEYLLQTDTDFGFLTEIASRVGYDWWLDAKGTLQFHPMGKPRGSATRISWGQENGGLKHFSVRASALHPQQVTVHGWDPNAQQMVTAVNDQVGNQPDAEIVQPYLKANNLSAKNAVQSAYTLFTNGDDGKALATNAAQRALAGAVVATGICTIEPKIAVGDQVSVTYVGPASGTYPVTEVEHIYSLSGFDTRFTAGEREPTSLADTLAAPPVASLRQDALVVGVVTNVGDSSSPKGYVKVRFPTLGSDIESAWARVVSTGAGDSRGMTFLPEVNDEVIVGFEGGDISRPLVIGGLYSGKSEALDYGAQDGRIGKRQIVSRLGHVVELGDGTSPADQHIWLTLAGGEFAIKLGKDGLAATVPSGQPVKVSSGDTSIELDKQGNITLSGQKVTIKATQDVEISGLNVKLKADVGVEGSGSTAKLSGSAQAEVSSGGQTSVKGAMVMIN